MELWQALVLALIQGLTEFLPISSSAHLILPQEVLGWPDQGLAFDVAVHVGSLLAVLWYFRHDLWTIGRAWLRSLYQKQGTPDSRMAWAIILATIPAGVCGIVFGGWIEAHLRGVAVIATTTIVFGVLLGWADYCNRRRESSVAGDVHLSESQGVPAGQTGGAVTFRVAILVGLAQVLALIPGTSRSGVTMTAGLALGLDRSQASRFSFLLSIPVILGAGLVKGKELVEVGASVPWLEIGLGVLVSAVTAWLCIHWFMKLIERVGFMPFVLYRLVLGGLLLALYVV